MDELYNDLMARRDPLSKYHEISEYFWRKCSNVPIASSILSELQVASLKPFEEHILIVLRNTVDAFKRLMDHDNFEEAFKLLETFIVEYFYGKYFMFVKSELQSLETSGNIDPNRHRSSIGPSPGRNRTLKIVFLKILYTINLCLHPFAPFLTEVNMIAFVT